MGLFRKSVRAHLMVSAAVGALTLGSGAAWAQSKPINIAPQTLASALHDFGSQTGHQIFFAPEVAASKVSPGVTGATDEQQALAQILEGTGLTFRREANAFIVEQQGEGGSDPQSGSAAGDGADSGTVEALIVTAQKREEDIQDVPIAISAFTQEQLENSQVAGGPDLMTQVPNFTFTKTNFSSYSIQIRGIGTQAVSATVDPAVAVAFNNTPFVRNRFFEQEFYDLQRVEVLRGPQGTLYGRNATAGVVNIISAKPSFQYEAKLSGDVANYNSTRLEGMVNIPLVEDKVALRLAGAWTKRDGYATNELTGNPIDGRDLWSTRLSLRIEPNDRISANLIWEHFEEDDDRLRSGKQLCKKDLPTEIAGLPVPDDGAISAPGSTYSQGCKPVSMYSDEAFQTPHGFSLPYFLPLGQLGLPVSNERPDPYRSATQSRDLRVIESTVDPIYRAKSDVGELQISFDLTDSLTLASETAYSTDVIWSMQDFNRFTTTPQAFNPDYDFAFREGVLDENGFFCDPQLGCSDRLLAVDLSTAKSRHFSQEFRLSSDFESPFNFNLGANFLRYDTEDKYYVFINTLTLVSATQNVVNSRAPAWVPNVSDNHHCLTTYRQGDPSQVQQLGLANCWYVDPNPIESVNDAGHNYFLSRNPYKLISYAVFGEAYYNITENLKVTAGLRWTVDKKEAPVIPSWVLAPATIGYPVALVTRQEWREPTGRLTIDWKPDLSFTDETLVYASYAHGYKAGGANPPPTTVVAYVDTGADTLLQESLTHPKTFEPEFVDAFEVGSKNTMLDGRLTLNATAFYYDYKGYQISQIVDRSAVNLNFDAEVWGLEIEADWRPLENLRLGFKGGYENTRVADGMEAIDLMDRTAGMPGWIVARPFPTVPSNCILPISVATWGGGEATVPGGETIPNAGPCLKAYQANLDPVTNLPYVPFPTVRENGANTAPLDPRWEGYPGFDPTTAPNNGEGFTKDLSGNALPNAPHFTATLTADYTLPLPNEWLATLHTDLYYQSEAWTRIFNTEGYDKLKAYTNVNLAAIFTNEDAGWKVMAYVKNVFDRDSITGAFLNSDDVGLTTNVFLTEPRLYGLRVTKEWTGLPWSLGGSEGPYPLTIELGGSVLRQDGDNDAVTDDSLATFSPTLLPDHIQQQDLDRGDGREVRIVYRPRATTWRIAAGARFGKANFANENFFSELGEESACALPATHPACSSDSPFAAHYPTNTSWLKAGRRDDFALADFSVGKDVGLGAPEAGHSTLSAGVGYARLRSRTSVDLLGIPDWALNDGFFLKYNSTHHVYDGSFSADREFEGAGPVISWDASRRLLGDEQTGHADLTWTVGGGVLFGKQSADIEGAILADSFIGRYLPAVDNPILLDSEVIPIDRHRSESVSVPTLNLSLGLAYEVDRFKIGAGYRWERYFDAIDGGDRERKTFDRTIDGPYLKLSVGFGGG
jgi:outer membrane receptor protein involved in Fe transport